MATQIRFKYPSWEKWVYFKSPNGSPLVWEVGSAPGKCKAIYRIFFDYTSMRSDVAAPAVCGAKSQGYATTGFPVIIDRVESSSLNGFLALKIYPIGGTSFLVYANNIPGNQSIKYQLNGCKPEPSWSNTHWGHTARNFAFQRTDNLPDNCGCQLTIKYQDTGEILHQMNADVCPTVEEAGCPPNSVCSCQKNNYICCYDASGNSIHSYLA